jgi:hypothetical protein
VQNLLILRQGGFIIDEGDTEKEGVNSANAPEVCIVYFGQLKGEHLMNGCSPPLELHSHINF